MSVTAILVLLLFSFGASFTQRVTGFGFGIFIMTVLPHLMPAYGEATTLSGILAIVCTITMTVEYWKYLEWKKLLPILVTFLIVSFFAVSLVAKIDSGLLKKVLGAILILVSVYFFFVSDRIRISPTLPVQIGMGTLSGLMGGLFAMQGPPAVIYFLASTKTKEEYAALASSYFIIGNVVMTVFRAQNGFVTPCVLKSALTGVPAVLLGIWLGSKVYHRMPIETMRKVVYAFLAVAGVIALLG